jgi:hypothetical protein
MSVGDWKSAVSVTTGRAQICQQVITIATALQDAWNTVLTSQASSSTVLNSYGRQYLGDVMPYSSVILGSIFLATTIQPVYPPSTVGTLSNGTGTAVGSPLTLSSGTNSVAITVAGNFTVALPSGHTGTVLSGTATVTGSPVTLGSGITTINVSDMGLITVIQSANNQTYAQSLAAVWPNATTTAPGGNVVGVGASIQNAASSMGMTTDTYMFLIFIVIMSFVMAVAAAALGGPQFIPILFIPVFVGCIKVGVVPMNLGVGVCAVLFIISMFFLIYRRANV